MIIKLATSHFWPSYQLSKLFPSVPSRSVSLWLSPPFIFFHLHGWLVLFFFCRFLLIRGVREYVVNDLRPYGIEYMGKYQVH